MNKTQCPHCFTVYVISDEQILESQGMVRCGTCRERFEAQIMAPHGAPKINLSDAFIEPLSGANEKAVQLDDFIGEPPSFSFKEMSESSFDNGSKSFSMNNYTFDGSLNSELSIQIDDEAVDQIDPEEIKELEKAIQQELRLPEREHSKQTDIELPTPESEKPQARPQAEETPENDLINQVDALVNKIIVPKEGQTSSKAGEKEGRVKSSDHQVNSAHASQAEAQESPSVSRDDFVNDLFNPPKKRRSLAFRSIVAVPLLATLVLLSLALLYQLWLKQIIFWPDNQSIQAKITPLITIAKDQLERSDVTLPIRRNLSQLELVSARTEAHPTRPTTLLLRVSLINHAKISQALPWLELTLLDADGRLLSRRNLAPQDYIYNNRVDASIGSKQLKRITVEMLAFPENATGYEVRMLNN